MRLYVVLFSGMARPKVPVTREEAGIEVPRPNRGRGGRRPPTALYGKEKEKENEDVKGKAKVDGNRGRLQLHDEGSNIDDGRPKDLVVARGEREGHASESSSSDSSAAGNTIETDCNVGGSSSGGAGHNEGEPEVSFEVRVPFPGGPIDGALLKSFKDHVAFSIWSNEERPVLKCINHGARIQEWDLQSRYPDTAGLQRIIRRSGLNTLIDCSYRKANKEVIYAFVERWLPETNTLHLPFGEMSISLEDVSFLLKILVTGKVVAVQNFARYTEESRSDAIKMVSNLLGVSVEEDEEEVNISKGLTVRKCWLKSRWCPKAGSRPRTYPHVECTARAYLLYFLSCTLFADKSGSRVSIALLKLLEDLDDVGKYAWGATALAYLYRHLGGATRVQVSQIVAYLTLLEGWVYDHFKLGLATSNAKYMDYVHPRVCRWIQKHETVANVDKLGSIRRTLDRLRPSEVNWDPYVNIRENGVVHAMAFYTGTIKYMDTVEPYHLERILRQFGFVQSIPDPPYRLLEAHRGPSANKYSVKYGFQQDNWERWRNHLLAPEVRGDKAEFEFFATLDYLPWFLKVSHSVITNPSHEDEDLLATTIADNELLERNRRALDAALR
ncbi:hypothetical protein Syun_025852 [Stephania yunnanensis]|uniref:Aminotransferase-like plant mobile domain-containing protein n=1 Tax=Stephania yunnanensis TaxID=152371 RepID=A0AAP0EXT4_9MAGN